MSIFQKGTLVPTTEISASGPIYGCDIYHEDNVTSFSTMRAAGIEFVYIKASQGLLADPKFVEYYKAAKAAGLIVGAYHFYSADPAQSSQAQFFWNICEAVGYAKIDLPPCFDFENASGDYNSSDASNCESFLSALNIASKRIPMLYMSDSVPEALGNPLWMKAYPWWIARYGAAPKNAYAIWQQSGTASIPGLNNQGDKNIFQGSVADLQTFISKT